MISWPLAKFIRVAPRSIRLVVSRGRAIKLAASRTEPFLLPPLLLFMICWPFALNCLLPIIRTSPAKFDYALLYSQHQRHSGKTQLTGKARPAIPATHGLYALNCSFMLFQSRSHFCMGKQWSGD